MIGTATVIEEVHGGEDDWNRYRDRRSENVSRLIRVIVMSAKNEM